MVAKAERWVAVAVIVLVLIPSIIAPTVWIIHTWGPAPDAPRAPSADVTSLHITALLIALAGVGGFVVLRRLRAPASRRYVALAIQHRVDDPLQSPGVRYTVAAWLALIATMVVTFALGTIADLQRWPPGEGWWPFSDEDYPGADHPTRLAASIIGLVVVCLYFAWDYRWRYEVPGLVSYHVLTPPGLLARQPNKTEFRALGFSVRLDLEALKERWLFFIRNLVIDSAFVIGAVVQGFLPGGEPLTWNQIEEEITMIFIGPGILSGLLIAIFLFFAATRRNAFRALLHPTSVTAVLLVVTPIILDGHGLLEERSLEVIAAIALVSGLLLATATYLQLMDRGSQPWFGLCLLALAYCYGYASTPAGPRGIGNWVLAGLALAYVVYEGRKHWNKYARPRPTLR